MEDKIIIKICDCILDGKTDGDKIEAKIKGKLIEKDGSRFITIESVDGEGVEEMAAEDNECSSEAMMEMDAVEALSHFMKKKSKIK